MPNELARVILVFGLSADLALIARTLFKVPQLCSPNRVKTQWLRRRFFSKTVPKKRPMQNILNLNLTLAMAIVRY
jgi:hypothetical protein